MGDEFVDTYGGFSVGDKVETDATNVTGLFRKTPRKLTIYSIYLDSEDNVFISFVEESLVVTNLRVLKLVPKSKRIFNWRKS
jgi:hypothetical protein